MSFAFDDLAVESPNLYVIIFLSSTTFLNQELVGFARLNLMGFVQLNSFQAFAVGITWG